MGNSASLQVPVWVTFEWDHHIEYQYTIPVRYDANCKIQHLINNKIAVPKQYEDLNGYKLKIKEIKKESFVDKAYKDNNIDNNEWNDLLNESITNYDKNSILQNGLHIMVKRIIKIPIIVKCHMEPLLECKFKLETERNNESMINIINHIICKLDKKYYPTKLMMDYIKKDSFIKEKIDDIDKFENKTLKDYDINNIINDGIIIVIKIKPFQYNMINKKKCDISKCVIYKKMVKYKSSEYTEINLNHLNECNHFDDEYKEKKKPECRHKPCSIYKQLIDRNNSLDITHSECHMNLYKHKMRKQRQLKLSELSLKTFFMDNNINNKHKNKLYRPSPAPTMIFDSYSIKDDELNGLIEEIINNGFESDLGEEIKDNDDDNDNKEYKYSILKVVDYKLNSKRHKIMGSPLNKSQILSLILYTSSDCGSIYDLLLSQTNGNYEKWKWFDFCLYRAICRLNTRECGDNNKLYSFIKDIEIKNKLIIHNGYNGYFKTYISIYSMLWNKDEKGIIIETDKTFRNETKCCDISWISMFKDESEIIVARSMFSNNFQCKLLNQQNGIQTVTLSNKLIVM